MGKGKDSSVTPTSILILSRRGWEGIRLQRCGLTLMLEKLLVASSPPQPVLLLVLEEWGG